MAILGRLALPRVRCAACGATGSLDAPDGPFEIHGSWTEVSRLIVRCRACRHGLVVVAHHGLLRVWPQTTAVIPRHLWQQIDSVQPDGRQVQARVPSRSDTRTSVGAR